DRQHTTGEDSGTWFPLPALRRAAARGRIGAVAARFHGAPTTRSQRTTVEIDAPEIVARCRSDGADAAILVANCPVCHQTTALVARQLEASGIATVVLGCALDIVEHVGVPRLVFSDLPLGNAAGRPNDPASQDRTLELALAVLESATAARTTVRSPLRWSDDPRWKLDYCNVDRLAPDEIERRRSAFDAAKAEANAERDAGRADPAADVARP
ncbi:MAG: hypothetical protein ACXWUL_02310, partial [Caldimonas sp.]